MLEVCEQYESPFSERFLATPNYEYSIGSSETSYSFEGYSSDIMDNEIFPVTQDHATLFEYTDARLVNLENHEDLLLKKSNYSNLSKKFMKYDREVLVDWLIWICHHCQFNDETLFSAVSIFDHYFLKTNDEENVYTAAVCSLWISTKLNEVRIPTVESLLDVCNNICTTKEILNFETKILNALKFKIIFPTYSHFNESLLSQVPIDEVFENYVSFFCHCALSSSELVTAKPSHISLASIILAKIATDTRMSFNVVIKSLSSIDEESIIKLIQSISLQSRNILKKIDSSLQMKFESLLLINLNDIENIEEKVKQMIPKKSFGFFDNI